MASKINIDPAAIKRNLDLIIVGVISLGLIGYGYMQFGATKEKRDGSYSKLTKKTSDYNSAKSVDVPDGFGFTNATVSTDLAHGNHELADQAMGVVTNHLNKVQASFKPLEIPDGIQVNPETGAILSVTLLNGGSKYSGSDVLKVQVADKLGKGKGAVLQAELRSVGGDTPESYRVENIRVVNGGSGYTKGQVVVVISNDGGAGDFGGPPPTQDFTSDPSGNDPSIGQPYPGQTPGGMPPSVMPGMGIGMGMMAGSMGVGGDDTEARVGIDDNTFLKFMHSKVYGLQRQGKEQRIRLPKFEEKEKVFRFGFSKVWDQPEFKPYEREIMCYQLAEIEALCQALFRANIHEVYNIRRLKIAGRGEAAEQSEEDFLEYLNENKFKIEDVKKFTDQVKGSRIMPYEVTFRGFSSEVSKVLEELYKSPVFFVVKNIAVIEATGVVDDFEEEEDDEMSLGGGGAGFNPREAYGPMGGGRGMRGMQGYGAMPFGMGFAGEEKKRRRPPSLLLDESPLKVTLRINSVKRVDPSKDDEGDAFAAMQAVVDDANKEDEDGGLEDLQGVYSDDDDFDDYEETITGHDPENSEDFPTQQEVDEALAERGESSE